MDNTHLQPLRSLVERVLSTVPKNERWLESMVMGTWYDLFSYTKDQISKTFIKGKTLYVHPKSTVLKHELTCNKLKMLEKLQEALKNRYSQASLLEDLVFI